MKSFPRQRMRPATDLHAPLLLLCLRRRARNHRQRDHRRRRADAVNELLIEARGAVEIATLNRPERLNALNEGLVDALNAYFGGLADRPEVRVVVLRGAGRGFCAGLDIQEDRSSSDETPVLRTLRTQTRIGNIYRKMRACPQPIIALGHGAAAGGGLSLLLASDVLLCGAVVQGERRLYPHRPRRVRHGVELFPARASSARASRPR